MKSRNWRNQTTEIFLPFLINLIAELSFICFWGIFIFSRSLIIFYEEKRVPKKIMLRHFSQFPLFPLFVFWLFWSNYCMGLKMQLDFSPRPEIWNVNVVVVDLILAWTHRQLDFISQPGVGTEILENAPESLLTFASFFIDF